MQHKLDIDICRAASKELEICGAPRPRLIEEAISLIQSDPMCLMKHYLGIKNYAHFGDQRCDCEYGMGPSHGHIVFSIGRSNYGIGKEVELGDAHIYYLQAYRDFGMWETGDKDSYGGPMKLSLSEFIRRLDKAKRELSVLKSALETKTVDLYEAPNNQTKVDHEC